MIPITICPHAVDLTYRRCAMCDDTLPERLTRAEAARDDAEGRLSEEVEFHARTRIALTAKLAEGKAEAFRNGALWMRQRASRACGDVFDQCHRGSDNWGRTAALQCQQDINDIVPVTPADTEHA